MQTNLASGLTPALPLQNPGYADDLDFNFNEITGRSLRAEPPSPGGL